VQALGVCWQVPEPSHVPADVAVAPEHEAGAQLVPAGAFWHAPVPSHVPIAPHGGFAAQAPCGSAAPAGTGLQLPALPTTLHA
jgi:hypothetical protein